MNPTYRLRRQAVSDLDAHAAYLADSSEETAERFLRAAMDAFEFLGQHPKAGAISGLIRNPDVRIWRVGPFRNHLVFYRVDGEQVSILRLLHAASDWVALLNAPGE